MRFLLLATVLVFSGCAAQSNEYQFGKDIQALRQKQETDTILLSRAILKLEQRINELKTTDDAAEKTPNTTGA